MLSAAINLKYFICAGLLVLIYSIMFWGLERADYILYFSLYSLAFLSHLYPFTKWGAQVNFGLLIGTGLVIRLLALSAFPTLSEDIYRYLWDGYLSQAGISPYAFTSDECIQINSIQEYPVLHSLYPFINSPSYYSVYPPVAQAFFIVGGWIASLWGISAAIVGLKSLLLIVELLGWFFVYQLFQIQKADQKWFWALWLNPLLILEWNFSGHIESLAATLVLGSVFFLKMKKHYLSGILLASAVLVKLWPLLFAPFFVKYLKSKPGKTKWIAAFVITGITGAAPLFIRVQYFIHFKTSLDLYFRTFEFNASVYYLFRAIGSWWYGYNPIHMAGPLCTILMLGICIWLYIKRRVTDAGHLMDSMLIIGITYLFFATTVHPWYLSILLPFAYLNARWSMVLWSYLIFASYFAYSTTPVTENLIIVAFTYTIVFAGIWLDWAGGKSQQP